jgi:hypothetical protein
MKKLLLILIIMCFVGVAWAVDPTPTPVPTQVPPPPTNLKIVTISFADQGLWNYIPDTGGWIKINSINPDDMIYCGDILYADFGSYGLLKWDGVTWTRLTVSDPIKMAVSGGCK